MISTASTRARSATAKRFRRQAFDFFGALENLVDDLRERLARVNQDCIVWSPAIPKAILPRPALQCDKLSIGLPSSELILRSLFQPLQQRTKLNIENEHGIEQVDGPPEVPRTAAEEGHGVLSIGSDRSYLIEIPEPALAQPRLTVPTTAVGAMSTGAYVVRNRNAGLRVTHIGQHAVAMDGLIAAPLQLGADRGLTTA